MMLLQLSILHRFSLSVYRTVAATSMKVLRSCFIDVDSALLSSLCHMPITFIEVALTVRYKLKEQQCRIENCDICVQHMRHIMIRALCNWNSQRMSVNVVNFIVFEAVFSKTHKNNIKNMMLVFLHSPSLVWKL